MILLSVILLLLAAVCAAVGVRQWREKGFLFHNAYLCASEKQRESMDKKPYYRQSAWIFWGISAVLFINAAEFALQSGWLGFLAAGAAAAVLVGAAASSWLLNKKKK